MRKFFRRGPDIPRVAGCVPIVSGQLVRTERRVVGSGVTWRDSRWHTERPVSGNAHNCSVCYLQLKKWLEQRCFWILLIYQSYFKAACASILTGYIGGSIYLILDINNAALSISLTWLCGDFVGLQAVREQMMPASISNSVKFMPTNRHITHRWTWSVPQLRNHIDSRLPRGWPPIDRRSAVLFDYKVIWKILFIYICICRIKETGVFSFSSFSGLSPVGRLSFLSVLTPWKKHLKYLKQLL